MKKHLLFDVVRRDADFKLVMDEYKIHLSKDGVKPDQWKALCPFHDDNDPSLKVNTAKNVYHCFVCGAKGNVLDFVMAVEGISVRTAALKAIEICGIVTPSNVSTGRKHLRTAPPKARRTSSTDPPAALDTHGQDEDGEPEGVSTNTPLTFELKLRKDDKLNRWLEHRGIDRQTQGQFGLGRASSRSKWIGNRLAIPLHDQHGRLIGYCGRYVGNDQPDGVAKYVLPKGFRKDLELFNLHRIEANPEVLVAFESYFSVMRFHHQVPCVSTFGRAMSSRQAKLIAELDPKRVIVVFDGDEPGRKGAAIVGGALAATTWTRIVDLPDSVKPHHLEWKELRSLLTRAYE